MSIRPQCVLGLDPLSIWLCCLGLCNATASFMKMMIHIFHDLLDEGVVILLMTYLAIPKMTEEHEKILKGSISQAKEAQFVC